MNRMSNIYDQRDKNPFFDIRDEKFTRDGLKKTKWIKTKFFGTNLMDFKGKKPIPVSSSNNSLPNDTN